MGFCPCHNSFIRIMSVVTFFGSSVFLLVATLLLIGYFLIKRKWYYAVAIGLISVSSTGIMFLLKQFFKRHRPLHPSGKLLLNYSFPSGHSVSSVVFCSILAYLLWKTNTGKTTSIVGVCALMLFSLLIGLSRIVLNYHFATDVIAGFCFGVVWVLLSFWVMKHCMRYNKQNDQVQTPPFNF